MTINELTKCDFLDLLCEGDDSDRAVKKVYCCDLLSIAMSRAPADSAWVTVMANMNTLAVASLADVSCVILAEGTVLDDICLAKAQSQGICVFRTELPVFDAALKLYQSIGGDL